MDKPLTNVFHPREQGFFLIIAGHSTLYVTRAEGWFRERPWPSPLLFGATDIGYTRSD